MATKKINKSNKGGSVCAVPTCVNYSGKLKHEGRTDISFHRFPKNLAYRKQWMYKCKRADKWNPSSSFICSDHFNTDDFIRNLQAELLGYTPKGRRLKFDAIPTLNLPGHFIKVSTSTANRNKRMETKAAKQAHDEIITLALNAEIPSVLNQLPTTSIDENIDYKTLYYDILKEHNKLKTKFSLQEKELISIKETCKSNISINESLQYQIKQLQKSVNDSNITLKQRQKTTTKQIKQLSEKKSRTIEIQAKKYLSTIFSKNQLDLMMKNKKQNELNYLLPGLFSLQRWAKSINFRNGVLEDVLKIIKLNGESMKSYENYQQSGRLNSKLIIIIDGALFCTTMTLLDKKRYGRIEFVYMTTKEPILLTNEISDSVVLLARLIAVRKAVFEEILLSTSIFNLSLMKHKLFLRYLLIHVYIIILLVNVVFFIMIINSLKNKITEFIKLHNTTYTIIIL
ncbi:Zinc finger, C2CH-type,Transposase protein, partial [Cinara cedri]